MINSGENSTAAAFHRRPSSPWHPAAEVLLMLLAIVALLTLRNGLHGSHGHSTRRI